ncbi:MAG TPA: glycosyltransferase family 1 protein [Terriglobales bacterium]
MRVGFDARWYNDSGVGAYVAGLLRRLAAVPRDFDLVVYTEPGNPVPDLDALAVTMIPVRAPKYSLAEQVELSQRAREDRLDIFHAPFFVVPLRLTCPLVVTVHDLIPFFFRIYPWPKQALIKIGYRVASRRARHIIADSANTARDLHTILGIAKDRITPVHLAPAECFTAGRRKDDLDCLEHHYSVRPPYVIAASARNWRTKNLETALGAISQAKRESGGAFQTVVYGPPDGIRDLSAEDRWPGLSLRKTGYVPAMDLARLFRHARAFVMPSLYEGFGLPIVEAMACGCPVITSNAGSLPEVAGDGAQVFTPSDVLGMAGAIAALLTDQENFDRWRDAALRRAADFSWERTAEQTISVYHRIHDQRLRARQLAFAGTGSR